MSVAVSACRAISMSVPQRHKVRASARRHENQGASGIASASLCVQSRQVLIGNMKAVPSLARLPSKQFGCKPLGHKAGVQPNNVFPLVFCFLGDPGSPGDHGDP